MDQRDKSKALVDLVCGETKSLNNTKAAIRRNKAELEAKRDRLLQELIKVNQAIDIADHDLSQIPLAITRLKGERQKHARQTYQLHKSLWPIPGSSKNDNHVIENVDQVHLRAIRVIQEALGSL